MNKTDIDKAAEREGLAMDRMHNRQRVRRVEQETATYNKAEFDKLFKKSMEFVECYPDWVRKEFNERL